MHSYCIIGFKVGTIGVKQGCQLSLALFSLHIGETSNYIERLGSSGAHLIGMDILILLYVEDIVLIYDMLEGLQRHLNTLKSLYTEKDLPATLIKPSKHG
mgnify:CR=1 FL=1